MENFIASILKAFEHNEDWECGLGDLSAPTKWTNTKTNMSFLVSISGHIQSADFTIEELKILNAGLSELIKNHRQKSFEYRRKAYLVFEEIYPVDGNEKQLSLV